MGGGKGGAGEVQRGYLLNLRVKVPWAMILECQGPDL